MLPHKHFLIAGLAAVSAAVIWAPERTVIEISKWAMVGGVASAAVDLDIIALVFLKSGKENRLRQFRNPLQVFRKFDLFMDTISETNVLKIGMKTHLIFSALIISISYFYLNAYFLPIALGVISHILSDIPNLRRKSV